MLFRWDKQVLVGNHIPTIFKCGVQFTSAFVYEKHCLHATYIGS